MYLNLGTVDLIKRYDEDLLIYIVLCLLVIF